MGEDPFRTIGKILSAPPRCRVRVAKTATKCHRPGDRDALVWWRHWRRRGIIPAGEDTEVFSIASGGIVFPGQTIPVCDQGHYRAKFVVPGAEEVDNDLPPQNV